MPTPLAKGVIIAASVLVAAGIAVYESPEFREWVERSSQKVALAFRSIGDDIHGRERRQQRNDSSMHEDADGKAEERRRQARDEIMEKGRMMQEGRKRRRSPNNNRTPSFDSLVDEEGRLRDGKAAPSAVDLEPSTTLRSRNGQPQMHESVDAAIPLRQLNNPSAAISALDPWESQYEQEMRDAWNIELPSREERDTHSHASESLIDLTPSTEDFPDPDYSIPSLAEHNPWQRQQYFSAAASQNSHTLSRDDTGSGAPLSQQMTPLHPRPMSPDQLVSALNSRAASQHNNPGAPSSHASMAGSTVNINHSEAEMTDDDLSELGDGIRTPGSVWTEVASSVSGDDLGHV